MLTHFAAGFPKIMHLIGDAAFWIDRDGRIGQDDADRAIVTAADEVGKKYVDQQVYRTLRSDDYRSILDEIARLSPSSLSFRKKDIEDSLSDGEKRKLNNFLQKMKKLSVLRSGEAAGEYVFNVRMVRTYLWLSSIRQPTS